MKSLGDAVRKLKRMEQGERPGEETGGDFTDNVRDATDSRGRVDLAKLDSKRTGRVNGGIACDVTRGPCRCGAWH